MSASGDESLLHDGGESRQDLVLKPREQAVACQRDGTTSLPRAWDHLEVSVSIAGLAFGVNVGALGESVSLSV